MKKYIKTFDNFKPRFISSPAPWSTVEEAKKFIIHVLIQRPDLTLQKFIELNKNIIKRYHEEGQKNFYDAVEKLNIPFWNKVR